MGDRSCVVSFIPELLPKSVSLLNCFNHSACRRYGLSADGLLEWNDGRGQGMVVDDKVIGFVLCMKLDMLSDGPEVITQVQDT